jgi:hypothetical protein
MLFLQERVRFDSVMRSWRFIDNKRAEFLFIQVDFWLLCELHFSPIEFCGAGFGFRLKHFLLTFGATSRNGRSLRPNTVGAYALLSLM